MCSACLLKRVIFICFRRLSRLFHQNPSMARSNEATAHAVRQWDKYGNLLFFEHFLKTHFLLGNNDVLFHYFIVWAQANNTKMLTLSFGRELTTLNVCVSVFMFIGCHLSSAILLSYCKIVVAFGRCINSLFIIWFYVNTIFCYIGWPAMHRNATQTMTDNKTFREVLNK